MSHFIYCYVKCRYTECRYAECRCAECRYAECRGALKERLARAKTLANWTHA
jgi:hypothetical protein